MGEDGIWHTAPAYDYTFSVDPSAPGYMNRHSMTINNKNADIERSDLLELAKRYNIKGADAIIKKVISVLGNYEQYAKTAGVSPELIYFIIFLYRFILMGLFFLLMPEPLLCIHPRIQYLFSFFS